MHYTYCPTCGSLLVQKPAGDDGMVPYCEKCEKLYFDSFPTCVIMLVANEYDEIVLLRQGYLSNQYCSFVAGYMTPGETAEEAAVREIREEIGLEVESLSYGGTTWFDKQGILMIGYIATAKKADFILSSEVDQAEWVHYTEAGALLFPDHPQNAAHRLLRAYTAQKQQI